MLVSTNRGMLFISMSGEDGPKTCVKCNPVSSAMYVVAAKKAIAIAVNGYRKKSGVSEFWYLIAWSGVNGARAKITHDDTTRSPVLYHLRCHNPIRQQAPEQRGHHTRVNSRDHHQRRPALLQEAPRRDELQREAQRVQDHEQLKLGPSHGRFASPGENDEEGTEEHAEAAGDDVGDVAE